MNKVLSQLYKKFKYKVKSPYLFLITITLTQPSPELWHTTITSWKRKLHEEVLMILISLNPSQWSHPRPATNSNFVWAVWCSYHEVRVCSSFPSVLSPPSMSVKSSYQWKWEFLKGIHSWFQCSRANCRHLQTFPLLVAGKVYQVFLIRFGFSWLLLRIATQFGYNWGNIKVFFEKEKKSEVI